MVERVATSASVIGLSLSRFSNTNFRTAGSRFLSGKIEISVLFVVAAVLFVSAAKTGVRSKMPLKAVKHPLVNSFIEICDILSSLKNRRYRCQKYLVYFQISRASFRACFRVLSERRSNSLLTVQWYVHTRFCGRFVDGSTSIMV